MNPFSDYPQPAPAPAEPTQIVPQPAWVRLRRNLHTLTVALREMVEERPLAKLDGVDVTPDQLRVLRLLAWNPGLRVGEIADALGVKPSSASLTLDRLERKAYVARYKEGHDRRITRLKLTDTGQDVFQRAETVITGKLDRSMSLLESSEITEITDNLGKLTRALVDGEKLTTALCFHCGITTSEDCPIGGMLAECPYRKSA